MIRICKKQGRSNEIQATLKVLEKEWNDSAPHGAGRLMSRSRARQSLDLALYRKEMEGIYTTSVNESTIDEAPMAYKSLTDIMDVICESVEIIEVLRPIYNYKASE